MNARALSQGFDMPGADVGIIRSSTSNVRQRIQTIGRLIRKKKDESTISDIWIIYVRDTIDERIFTKHDWQEEFPDIEVINQEDEVQTRWEIPEWTSESDTDDNFIPYYVGGVESLPQPERSLTDEELNSINIDGLECGDDYPDPRAIRSTSKIIRVSENGDMKIIDGGAPFIFNYPSLTESAIWLSINRKKNGMINIIENGHAIARSISGKIIFLQAVDLDEIKKAIDDVDDSFDAFLDGFDS